MAKEKSGSRKIEAGFYDELRLIVNQYKESSGDEPLDGDEVDKLVEHLRNGINLMEGNLTEDEYLELEEKGHDGVIKICVENNLDSEHWEEIEDVIRDALIEYGVKARIEDPNTGNSTVTYRR